MRRITWLGAIASAVLASACATASQPQATTLVESRTAVRLAEEAGAANDPQAAHYLAVARQQVAEAERLMREGRERTAQRVLERAEVHANLAREHALQAQANDPDPVAVHVRIDTTSTQPAQPAPSVAESELATKQAAERAAALQAQVDVLHVEKDQSDRERTQAEKERDEALATLRGFASVNENDERGLVITMPAEIMFRSGSSALLPRAKEKLDDVASALHKLAGEQTFVIEGHTDSRGSAAFNQRLSKMRADAVRSYLIEQGVSRDRIIARGRGEDDPVASNGSAEGRANNRRVELVVSPSIVGGR